MFGYVACQKAVLTNMERLLLLASVAVLFLSIALTGAEQTGATFVGATSVSDNSFSVIDCFSGRGSYVSSQELSIQKTGQTHRIESTIRVRIDSDEDCAVDATDIPAVGAQVNFTLESEPSGEVIRAESGVTDQSGTYSTGRLRNIPNGQYLARVDIELSGHGHASSLDTNNPLEITLPTP